MKLTTETLSVLKNFSTINAGMQFKKGRMLSTVSPSKTIMALATLTASQDDIPDDFCVYDLNEFLSVIALQPDTDLEFDATSIIFKAGRSKIKYRKTPVEMIVTPPAKPITLPSIDVSFKLPVETYNFIMKTAAILSSPHIAIESDGEMVFIKTFDAANDSAHTNATEIDKGTGAKYRIVFKTENFKMIPDTYDVKVSFKGIGHFKGNRTEYWVAVEKKESQLA